ncbi:DUF636 domain protein [Cryphonectria parasitica EP155]|uniref:DUF636 domain protein n=1 Tax=Cryphonectria parasitica (strain ATCC 38755 / EP155) TaxID=660469 RepID=A0A9P4Y813_CRYP1|nr:DUF636 domain protein [Cryphonectria parasitica EP155]KAF3768119.1 DUF636 domain protein [Cryphonectria parasitica EP155]
MADPSSSPTKTLSAACYCKAVQYSVEIPTSDLPLPVHLCHCSICRYTHGTLCIFHTTLPQGVSLKFTPPSSLHKMTGYSHANAQAERFFCSTCGCHVGDVGPISADASAPGATEWVVASALFAEHGEDVFQIKTHCFTEGSTGGSGLFSFLPKLSIRDLKVWNPGPDSGWWSAKIKDQLPMQEFDEAGNEALRAECHCGGVSFTIPRPTTPAIREDPYLSNYISPKDNNKWLGCLDPCDDCRLQCGTLVTAWTFVPRAHIQPPMPLKLAPYGTMKTFASSEGVLRGFCGTCGATVVYSCDERTPTPEQQIIDVSVGLLRAPEGVLAEKWMTWRAGRLANIESAKKFSPEFAESLAEGMEKWSREKYGNAPNFNIG